MEGMQKKMAQMMERCLIYKSMIQGGGMKKKDSLKQPK